MADLSFTPDSEPLAVLATRAINGDREASDALERLVDDQPGLRVFLGAGEREDLVQCHRCWRIVADDERAAHLRWHAFDDKNRRCATHNRARYWCGCWTPSSR